MTRYCKNIQSKSFCVYSTSNAGGFAFAFNPKLQICRYIFLFERKVTGKTLGCILRILKCTLHKKTIYTLEKEKNKELKNKKNNKIQLEFHRKTTHDQILVSTFRCS